MKSRQARRYRGLYGPGALAAVSIALAVPDHADAAKSQPDPELTAIAEDAYVYGYPLVLMDATKRAMTSVDSAGPRGAPVNQFLHSRSTPNPSTRWVVRPNLDTLYSNAWLDLSKEPVVLRIPQITDRYFVLQMMDGWTNVFAAPGTRTVKPGEHTYAIVGPSYKGTLPPGVEHIHSPTDMVWILGRTQINGPDDEEAARAVESEYTLQPLSAFEEGTPPVVNEPVDMEPAKEAPPPEQVAQMDGTAFFTKLSELMQDNPAPQGDAPALQRFAAIGFVPGEMFAPSVEVRRALADVPANALKTIEESDRSVALVNGWLIFGKDVGAFGTHYKERAVIAMKGLGANRVEDAVYPSAWVDADGQPLTGQHRYVLHFAAGETPPVDAFWSLTLYDEEGHLVENPIDRYALRDRDPLEQNQDGSLDLYIQHDAPAPEQRANWLPAPSGGFNLALRLYMPEEQVMNGTWKPPAVQRVP